MYENETKDLELHVNLCHLRYQQLEQRLTKLEEDVGEIKQDIINGHKSLKATIITTAGTIIVALVGLIAAILTKF